METPRPDLNVTLPPRPFLPTHKPLSRPPYTSIPVLSPAFTAGLSSAGVGLFISAVKNSLDQHQKGALGVFTRTGWIIGYFASAGFLFTAVNNTVSNIRESSTDGVSGFSGGCASGFILGLRQGSIPKAMGTCLFVGSAVGTFDLAGGKLGYEDGKKTRAQREKERLDFFRREEDGVTE